MRIGSTSVTVGSLIVGLCAWVGCSGAAPVEEVLPVIDATVEAVEPDATPQSVVAAIQAVGPSGRAPVEVAVRLSEPRYSAEQVGRPVPSTTQWSIEPNVEGELRVSADDQLVFVPSTGFRPGETYRFDLRALAAPDGAQSTPEEGQDWSVTFTVPEFQVLRIATFRHDPVAMKAEIDVVFTSDVNIGSASKGVSFQMNGETVVPDRVEQGPLGDTVRFAFFGRRFSEPGVLKATVAPGIRARAFPDLRAPAGTYDVSLRSGEPIEIVAAVVKESSSGFFIDVICRDPAAGGERWYWDPDTYDGWWTTSRCMPDPDLAAGLVHVSLVSKVSIASSPGGFRIFGDLRAGTVDLKLDAGLRSVDGGVLRKTYATELRIPHRSSRLNFTTKGRYVPRTAWGEVPIQSVNVDITDVEVRHVPPENLVYWLGGSEEASRQTSNVVSKSTFNLGGPTDVVSTRWLNLADLVPDPQRGVYEIRVDAKSHSARDALRVLLSDMLLIAKVSDAKPGQEWGTEAAVWVRDVHSGGAVPGVEVSAVRMSGQVMGKCRTDAVGGCTLQMATDEIDDSPPFVLIARKADDLTYLRFSDLRVSPETDVGGKGWTADSDASAYQAAVYLDRGVYRPGDVVHASVILRTDSFTAPPAGVPVSFSAYSPQHQSVSSEIVNMDANGMALFRFRLSDFAETGTWHIEASVGDELVATVDVRVEEFVPERMRVSAKPGGEQLLAHEPVPFVVHGDWLFGGSAAGSRAEMACVLRSHTFRSEAFPGHRFGLAPAADSAPKALQLGLVQGTLNADGDLRLDCPAVEESAGRFGAARMDVSVSVFEGQSGRTTDTTASSVVHPESYYVGVRPNVDSARAGAPISFDGVLVDLAGNRLNKGVPANVAVTVYKLDEEFGWWWDEESGESNYRRLLRRSEMEKFELPVAQSGFTHRWTPPTEAAGFVLVYDAGMARTEVFLEGSGRRFLWSPRDSAVDSTPRPVRPSQLEIVLPETAEVGGTVTASTKVPYAGYMLWTVETDRVLRSEWKKVEAGEVTWSFPVDSFYVNLYVSAFVVKDPHLESKDAFLPDRAFGVNSVWIRPSAHLRTVNLTVPKEIRPYSRFEVGIDVGPLDAPASATIAVVDEGILQLTRFESPDPNLQLFSRRRLEVDTYETVGWSVLSEPRGPSSSTGGDDSGMPSGRVQMVKPVALWEGTVEIPTSGKITVPFEVPGYRGDLRVMVVAATPTQVGHATANVVVREPLVLTTTLPRFLLQGDIASVPVQVTNMSGAKRTVDVRLRAEGFDPFEGKIPSPGRSESPVVVLGAMSKSIDLGVGESKSVVFDVRADMAPAAARFQVEASSGNLLSIEKIELPVSASMPEDRRVSMQKFQGTTTLDIDELVRSQGWLPGGDTTTVWVTTNPYALAMTHLSYVVRYPHGCLEQTTSSTRPLLYVRNIVDEIDASLLENGSVDDMVAAGINRVLSMQTAIGGFAYWPGSSRPELWGTAYALHMLLDAQAAGFAVPEEPVSRAVKWLTQEVDSSAANERVFTSQPYAYYVLARAGVDRSAVIEAALERVNRSLLVESSWSKGALTEHKFLLMAASQLNGDRRYEKLLRAEPTDMSPEERVRSAPFYSDLRGRALRLDVLSDLFPGSDLDMPLAAAVANDLAQRPSRGYTTQEIAWGVSALGKQLQLLKRSSVEASLSLAGKEWESTAASKGQSWTLRGLSRFQDVDLTVKGRGDFFVLTTVEGARLVDDVPVGGEGIKAERSYWTETGEPLDPSKLALGDRFVIRLDIVNPIRDNIEDVAVVDRIPAGWEIEEIFLDSEQMPAWAGTIEYNSLDYQAVLDDRLRIYADLSMERTHTFFYVVRAVTAGTFRIPDLTVEAMYAPEFWARVTGGQTTVVGPWEAKAN